LELKSKKKTTCGHVVASRYVAKFIKIKKQRIIYSTYQFPSIIIKARTFPPTEKTAARELTHAAKKSLRSKVHKNKKK